MSDLQQPQEDVSTFQLIKPVLYFLLGVSVFVIIGIVIINTLSSSSFTTNFPTTDGSQPLWPIADERVDYTTYAPTIRWPDGGSPGEFGYAGPAGIYSGWVKPPSPASTLILNTDESKNMEEYSMGYLPEIERGNLF